MTPISTSSAEYKQFKEAFTQYAQYTAAVNNLRIFVEENKESYKVSSVMVSDPGSAVLVTHPLVTFSDPP
ncbi:hypothetical protein [Neochlamydia sp. S13]|uniref:hypothetical protein n=1 Tax=Neochlamydia sp. S13 TaxID=1353976 RepID=UPI0005A5FEB8|nr:hypothetical protein [Neochlamydia sp. S13]BBI17176.1 hypothetical protein NCS13_1_0981 [Neochlamydia sp. S13]